CSRARHCRPAIPAALGFAAERRWPKGVGVMQNVSRFEASLLRLLYYFLLREPVDRALPLVEQRCQQPPWAGIMTVPSAESGRNCLRPASSVIDGPEKKKRILLTIRYVWRK